MLWKRKRRPASACGARGWSFDAGAFTRPCALPKCLFRVEANEFFCQAHLAMTPPDLARVMARHAPPWETLADKAHFLLAARDARNRITGETETPAASRYGRDPRGWPRHWFERASPKRDGSVLRGASGT